MRWIDLTPSASSQVSIGDVLKDNQDCDPSHRPFFLLYDQDESGAHQSFEIPESLQVSTVEKPPPCVALIADISYACSIQSTRTMSCSSVRCCHWRTVAILMRPRAMSRCERPRHDHYEYSISKSHLMCYFKVPGLCRAGLYPTRQARPGRVVIRTRRRMPHVFASLSFLLTCHPRRLVITFRPRPNAHRPRRSE